MKRGLGGVQQSFLSYYNYANKFSGFKQFIYSNHNKSKNYGRLQNFFKIQKNLISFIYHLVSKNSIIHFHNKLSSKKIFYILKFFSTKNIVFHEHGSAWNVKTKQQIKTFQNNAKIAKKIIVNSLATKHMLVKKFKIDKKKLALIYYGFNDPKINKKNINKKKLKIGFIGRLESVKGAHLFIEAANLLKNKNLSFLLAGDGHLEKDLKLLSKQNKKIKFIGNVVNPIQFIKTLDILIVPSIREPLGIVNIEAGLCKIPVIASKIDGIPEVITNNYSGILINPTKKITLKQYEDYPSLPDFVIDPKTYKIKKPKQIDPKILSKKILFLSKNKQNRIKYGYRLYKNVKKKFSIKNYFDKIENIYKEF